MSNLAKEEVERYHRQILLKEFGPEAQEKLKASKVLVVGAGGLGSPLLLYLAGAGIGTIGVVDGDKVETINLHRQVIHTTPNTNKAQSAKDSISSLNPLVTCNAYPFHLTAQNSQSIIPHYDVLVIATDNVPSRYLVSDLGVYYNKPVVSASALRWEGQLMVLSPSPCYRCYFPIATPRKAWTRASDVGVLGPVPGVLGTLQAIEVIKLILSIPAFSSKMLMYDALLCKFREFKMRDKDPNCVACSQKINPHEYDYEAFIGEEEKVEEMPSKQVTSEELEKLLATNNVLVLDLRNTNHFKVDHIQGSQNVNLHEIEGYTELYSSNKPLVLVCKEGKDSAKAVGLLAKKGLEASYLRGGLVSWQETHSEFLMF